MNNLIKSHLTFLATCLALSTANAQMDTLKTINVNCGDTITESVKLGNDLNCSSTTDYALKIMGDNIVVDGAGHKITATKSNAAIYAEGSNIQIKKVSATGNSNGYGLLAHNTPKLQVTENDFSKNNIGVMVHADGKLVDGVVVDNNTITNSKTFGIRAYGTTSGIIKNPKITNNNLSQSGDYAIYVMASEYLVKGSDNNLINGSTNGYYLKDGIFFVVDLDLSKQLILKRHIFVDSAEYVELKRVDVTSIAKDIGTEERIGVDIYRATRFFVSGLVSTAGDVGLQLETEKGAKTNGEVTDSMFTSHKFAGIAIVSYDNTKYGRVDVVQTVFCEPRSEITVHEGTKINLNHEKQPTICPDNGGGSSVEPGSSINDGGSVVNDSIAN